MTKKIQLQPGKEKSLLRFHPWVFSGAIASNTSDIEEGETVEVFSGKKEFLGLGHFQKGSIAVKIFSFEKADAGPEFWKRKIMAAARLRKLLGYPSANTNAFRLVHGEGDMLPGLIVDIYADTAVMQFHSVGMEKLAGTFGEILLGNDLFTIKNVVVKGLSSANRGTAQILTGEVTAPVEVLEEGLKYQVDVVQGQKTGFFLDQRDNRALLRKYAGDKSVMNVFSYSGGFSVSALAGGARQVLGIDASATALELGGQNAALNGFSEKHESLKADAVPYLEQASQTWDIIVLDPPAFAKHRSARHSAIQAYRRINEAAIKLLNSGGLLFTFSCSQVVDEQLFHDTIVSAAIRCGKTARVLHRLRQGADHPVNIFHPEGEYLKGLLIHVE